MDRVYYIFLDDKIIGTTLFEKADAPMGVVFGQIRFKIIETPYDFFKSYCKKNKIDFEDYPDDKIIATQIIPALRITNDRGQEIAGVGNQISGMESDYIRINR